MILMLISSVKAHEQSQLQKLKDLKIFQHEFHTFIIKVHLIQMHSSVNRRTNPHISISALCQPYCLISYYSVDHCLAAINSKLLAIRTKMLIIRLSAHESNFKCLSRLLPRVNFFSAQVQQVYQTILARQLMGENFYQPIDRLICRSSNCAQIIFILTQIFLVSVILLSIRCSPSSLKTNFP